MRNQYISVAKKEGGCTSEFKALVDDTLTFAVHHTIIHAGSIEIVLNDRWTVTHIKTGAAVIWDARRRCDAIGAIQELLSLPIDWKSVEKVPNEFKASVKQIQAKYNKGRRKGDGSRKEGDKVPSGTP